MDVASRPRLRTVQDGRVPDQAVINDSDEIVEQDKDSLWATSVFGTDATVAPERVVQMARKVARCWHLIVSSSITQGTYRKFIYQEEMARAHRDGYGGKAIRSCPNCDEFCLLPQLCV